MLLAWGICASPIEHYLRSCLSRKLMQGSMLTPCCASSPHQRTHPSTECRWRPAEDCKDDTGTTSASWESRACAPARGSCWWARVWWYRREPWLCKHRCPLAMVAQRAAQGQTDGDAILASHSQRMPQRGRPEGFPARCQRNTRRQKCWHQRSRTSGGARLHFTNLGRAPKNRSSRSSWPSSTPSHRWKRREFLDANARFGNYLLQAFSPNPRGPAVRRRGLRSQSHLPKPSFSIPPSGSLVNPGMAATRDMH